MTTIGALAQEGTLDLGDGYRTRRGEHGRPGFRILRVADVGDGSIDLDGPDFVAESYRRQIGDKLSQPGDVLLTTKGTVGRVAVMPPASQPVVYSPQLCYFRIRDTNVLDARYLRYWFKSDAFGRQASHRMNNTDMAAYINLADIRSLRLDLPPIAEQRAIAEVLGALDDKIAANACVVAGSDDLARQIYVAMAREGVDEPLSTCAEFVNGRAFTNGASGTGRVVIRIAELNSGIGGSTVFNDIPVADQHLARPGDLLFAWSGSLTVRRWYRPEGIVNQHIFKVVPKDGYPMWLVNQLTRQKLADFKAIAADKATTMGHIQRRHLDEPVRVPRPESMVHRDALMAGLWERALAAEVESLRLATMRDALLPLLMSGRLRVGAAERVVEEVGA